METEELKNQVADAAGDVKNAAEDLLKKAEDVINDISENETVKAVREKVEDLVSDENLKNVKEKVDGVLNDIAENETVKAVREKIEDTVEQITSSETAKQPGIFPSRRLRGAGISVSFCRIVLTFCTFVRQIVKLHQLQHEKGFIMCAGLYDGQCMLCRGHHHSL